MQNVTELQCVTNNSVICMYSKGTLAILSSALLLIGSFGNILNIALLFRKNLRNKPVFLLVFLAFFDLLVLWTHIPSTILKIVWSSELFGSSKPLCHLVSWATFFAASSSVWTIALVTLERCIVVSRGADNDILPSRNKNVCLLLGIIGVVMITSLILIFGTSFKQRICPRRIEGETGAGSLAAIVVLYFIPGIIVGLGNTFLFYKIKKQNENVPINSQCKSQTKLPILLTILTLVTFMPYLATNTLISYGGLSSMEIPWLPLIQALALCLFWCNYTFNFVCYLWSGSLFKKEICLMWRELKRFCSKPPSAVGPSSLDETNV